MNEEQQRCQTLYAGANSLKMGVAITRGWRHMITIPDPNPNPNPDPNP